VLALLVAIASMSWPLLDSTFSNHRLRKGGDALRAAWNTARLDAMRSGQTQLFQFEYNTGVYLTSIYNVADSDIEASSSTLAAERPGKLPEGVLFHASEKLLDERLASADVSQTTPQVFFYPDGTTSTVQVLLANDRERFVRVELRGLTGTAALSEILSEKDLGQ